MGNAGPPPIFVQTNIQQSARSTISVCRLYAFLSQTPVPLR
ncbi:hypothetical protein HMPREF9441_03774 [Paraprevotella clara YIT 11840]|uniref:Uncharacterized protein n=1 Tax=Paraprevotella clara YIT 11840 TaxID=762968 RepID=G5SWK1_9BACT|nr:hypothetical protein HMPREF9441_03774 [Paraprevotella clara YIT 11840]